SDDDVELHLLHAVEAQAVDHGEAAALGDGGGDGNVFRPLHVAGQRDGGVADRHDVNLGERHGAAELGVEVFNVGLDDDLVDFLDALDVFEFQPGDASTDADEDDRGGIALDCADGQDAFLGVGHGTDAFFREHLEPDGSVEQHDDLSRLRRTGLGGEPRWD